MRPHMPYQFQWVLDRVTELEAANKEQADRPEIKEDLKDLTEELLVSADKAFNFPNLSGRMIERQSLDLSSLREAAQIFRRFRWTDPVHVTSALTVVSEEAISALE